MRRLPGESWWAGCRRGRSCTVPPLSNLLRTSTLGFFPTPRCSLLSGGAIPFRRYRVILTPAMTQPLVASPAADPSTQTPLTHVHPFGLGQGNELLALRHDGFHLPWHGRSPEQAFHAYWCNPCPRTSATYVLGLYTRQGRGDFLIGGPAWFGAGEGRAGGMGVTRGSGTGRTFGGGRLWWRGGGRAW